jgi:hypothetical protein
MASLPWPRTKREQFAHHRLARSPIAWVGWQAARTIPFKPMPPNSLTLMHQTLITPEMVIAMAEKETALTDPVIP